MLAANAQQSRNMDVDFLTEADLLNDAAIGDENAVSIRQVGTNNDIEVVQRQLYQQGNQTRVLQRGDENYAQLIQAGGNNEVILLQYGSDNTYRLDLVGSNNDIAVIQNGDHNEINQSLIDSRNVNIEFIQNGDGNLIEHQADGLISKDIKVLQTGSNMQVIINQTTALPPSGN